jgi:hypothetical protein
MRPLSTASSVSFTGTSAPAGRISKVTGVVGERRDVGGELLQHGDFVALVGITDCTRILTVFGACAHAMAGASAAAARAGPRG